MAPEIIDKYVLDHFGTPAEEAETKTIEPQIIKKIKIQQDNESPPQQTPLKHITISEVPTNATQITLQTPELKIIQIIKETGATTLAQVYKQLTDPIDIKYLKEHRQEFEFEMQMNQELQTQTPPTKEEWGLNSKIIKFINT